MIIGLDGRARIAKDVHARRFDGELVILDLKRGDYWALDAVGARLWEALDQGRTPRQVAAEVSPIFDVSEEQLLRDLEALTEELARRHLIVPRDSE